MACQPARRAACIFALVLVTASAAAQSPPEGFIHEQWTTSDGLPVNGLTDIVQTRDGYLWIATWDGLVRFDGVRFTVFNRSNTPGLPSNRLFDLYESPDGTLWIRTEHNHLAAFRHGVVETYGPDSGLRGREVHRLYPDTDSTLLVATEEGLFAWRDGRFVPRWRYAQASGARPGGRLFPSVVLRDRQDALWIGTFDAGLVRVEGARANVFSQAEGRPLASILGMAEDARGRIWISANPWQRNRQEHTTEGLFLVAGDSLRRMHFGVPGRLAAWATGARLVWRQGDRCVLAYEGLYFQGTGADGVWDWSTTTDLGPGPDGRRSLLGWDFVYREDGFALRLPYHPYGARWDHEGSLWLASNGDGLHRFKPVPFATYGTREGLPHENVYPTVVDRRGRLWTAALGLLGVMRLEPGGSASARVMLESEAVLSLYEDREGTMWVGTNTGVCRFEGSGMFAAGRAASGDRACRWLDLPGYEQRPVYAIYQDRDGGHWVSSDRMLWRLLDDTWTAYPQVFEPGRVPAGTASASGSRRERRAQGGAVFREAMQVHPLRERIRTITEDRRGTLWFGAAVGGLAAYVPDPVEGYRKGRFYHLTSADGLPSDVIRDLYADDEGFLWVVTEDAGLARLDLRDAATPAEARIAVIQQRHGLPEDALHSLQADAFGRFWISSNRGLFWVDREELGAFADGRATGFRATLYTERDGLRNREFNGGYYPAGSRGPDGRLWFPSQAGAVAVDPARVQVLPPPRVVIEQVVTGGTARPVSTGFILAAEERTFEVDYTALSFLVPEDVRFRYRLEGYDDGWVEAGDRRTAYYTQVPAGTYTFRVTAAGKDGVWNEAGAALRLTVRPFFYETVWFLGLCVLLLGGLVGAGFRWRVRQLQLRQHQLEAVVAARTREIAQALETVASQAAQLRRLDASKSRFFANISHEFRTPLTLILGPLQQLLDRSDVPPWMRGSLGLVQRNAHRLFHLINQLLDLARLDAGGLQLQLRRQDLAAFVRQCTVLFESLARLRGIELHVDTAPLPFAFDEEKLEKVVLNLLSNALKFTSEGGTVAVILTRRADGQAHLAVSDTGIGIPPEHLPHIFDRFYQVDGTSTRRREGSGIGLALAHELVVLHGGTLEVESEPGRGTTFVVTLPDRPAVAGEEETGTAGDGTAPTLPAIPLPPSVLDAYAGFGQEGAGTPVDAVARPAPVSGKAEPVEASPIVLVVEDNADLRRYVRSHLEGSFQVVEAADGPAGLAEALARVPDLVLSDVMMPGMDGYALCRTLKTDARTSHIPVVLLTARDDVPSRLEGLDTGADDYLPKPFHPEELRLRLRNLVEQRRRLRLRYSRSVLVLGADEVALPAREVDFLEQVKAAIHAHLAEPDFGVEALAAGLGMSRSQLERKLQALVGEAPGSLLRRVRLERAAQLLRREGAAVKEVAAAVGYRSVSHFSEAFRQSYGVPPSALVAPRS